MAKLTAAVKGGAVDVEWWRFDPSIDARPASLLERAANTRVTEADDVEFRLLGFAYEGFTDPLALVRVRHFALPLWPLLLLGAVAPFRWLRARRRTTKSEMPAEQPDDPLGGPVVRIGVLVALAIAVAFFAFSHFTAFLLIAIGLIVLGSGAESLGLSRAARAEARRVRGQCVRCGYDVRGSRARCPECGEVITPYVRPGSRGA